HARLHLRRRRRAAPELPPRRPFISERTTHSRATAATQWGQAVNQPVLSVTRTPVPSGTAVPSYQEPKPHLTCGSASRIRAPNLANRESFGFLLTPDARWGSLPAAEPSGCSASRQAVTRAAP